MRKFAAFFSAFIFAAAPLAAQAGLIRDAEIENTLRAYADPIFQSAGIPPEDVRILIVSDPSINAFVAGGLNVFVHTGLIEATTKPGEMIGVIAHETGHIAGAHLTQLSEKSSRASLGAVIGSLLGAAIMVGGGGQAGAGVMMGTQGMAQRQLMGDIRINEQSADHAAMKYMDENDISSSGMLSMFETLRRKEAGAGFAKDAFMRDHPLTSERIATVRNHIKESSIPADQVPSGFDEKQARMVAKLIAFTAPYERTLALYPENDTSIAARYAHAIAAFKHSDLKTANAEIDALIKQRPNDPFFYDTKGQINFENGKLDAAEAAYAKANKLLPGNALLLTDHARTLIARDHPGDLDKATALLEQSKEVDDSYATTWRQLAIAYGKKGKLGPSYSALAEEAALEGDYRSVLQHVARARGYVKDDPSLAVVLDDQQREAQAQLDKKKEKNLF